MAETKWYLGHRPDLNCSRGFLNLVGNTSHGIDCSSFYILGFRYFLCLSYLSIRHLESCVLNLFGSWTSLCFKLPSNNIFWIKTFFYKNQASSYQKHSKKQDNKICMWPYGRKDTHIYTQTVTPTALLAIFYYHIQTSPILGEVLKHHSSALTAIP